jgi:hypothetical protein
MRDIPPTKLTTRAVTQCTCCKDENLYMYEGTTGKVYCYTCSRRGTVGHKCGRCGSQPTMITRQFKVEFKGPRR